MNDVLRKAINIRNMHKRRFYKCKTRANWCKYRKQRNSVNSLRKKSLHNYIYEKCKQPNMCNGKDFWHTVKPLISDKCKGGQSPITLMNNGNIVNDQEYVSNIFNDYYVHITKDIGQTDKINYGSGLSDIVARHKNKDSIKRIQDVIGNEKCFTFNSVSCEEICNKLLRLDCKKSTGYDNVPPKLVKLGAMQLCIPVTSLINRSIKSCLFPDLLKRAEVTPIYKKGDIMNKKNYRPVSVLPCMSKIFESVMVEQVTEYFSDIFSPYLSGFRKQHSCQSVLLHYVEKCKQALDSNKVYGALLTDLSKAFDCLPHCLLIAKLKAYGVCEKSCMLIATYLQERFQRVKIGNSKSEWLQLAKGCPQGSLMGPLAYNIFSNDLLLLLGDICDIYNYADDNTPGCQGDSEMEVIQKLEAVASIMLEWFHLNYLQANPDKFQLILHGKSNKASILNIGNNVKLEPLCDVRLLGVTIDAQLNFSKHVDTLCKKAGKQINVLHRMSRTLSQDAKFKLFETFVLSNFNFCPVVWHHCRMSDIRKIENVQKRALRMVYNDYESCYKDLRVRSKRPLLYIQRLRMIVLEMYKIYYDIGPIYLKEFVNKTECVYNTRNRNRVDIPICNTVTYGYNSFKYEGASLWNKLCKTLKQELDVNNFKNLIKEWNGPECSCTLCKLCRLKNM